ncbi:hypothetical protein GJ744_008495 [Endocarpon pusillum]|uniref:Uncharacterized protein n=1 Tax=Endocarpon pusillum TaxID=364733 RepID=A0A8H7AK88_9EURO|nr:hypothetical protein GJ744_008495 [Endocarpon pusillum]
MATGPVAGTPGPRGHRRLGRPHWKRAAESSHRASNRPFTTNGTRSPSALQTHCIENQRSTREQAFWLTLVNGSFHERAGYLSRMSTIYPSPCRIVMELLLHLNLSASSPAIDATNSSHWHKWWSSMHARSDFLGVDSLAVNTCVIAMTVNRRSS